MKELVNVGDFHSKIERFDNIKNSRCFKIIAFSSLSVTTEFKVVEAFLWLLQQLNTGDLFRFTCVLMIAPVLRLAIAATVTTFVASGALEMSHSTTGTEELGCFCRRNRDLLSLNVNLFRKNSGP